MNNPEKLEICVGSEPYEVLFFDKLLESNPELANTLFTNNLSALNETIIGFNSNYKNVTIKLSSNYIKSNLNDFGYEELKKFLYKEIKNKFNNKNNVPCIITIE